MTSRSVLLAAFILLSLAVLAATPIAAGFSLRDFACDFGPSPDWATTILNFRHIASYGILAAVAFLAFADRPLWVPIVVTLAVTAGAELTQAVFASGHCRLRDMIPNVLAVGAGWLLAWGISRLPQMPRKT